MIRLFVLLLIVAGCANSGTVASPDVLSPQAQVKAAVQTQKTVTYGSDPWISRIPVIVGAVVMLKLADVFARGFGNYLSHRLTKRSERKGQQ